MIDAVRTPHAQFNLHEHRWYFTLGVGINVLNKTNKKSPFFWFSILIMWLQYCLHPIQHRNLIYIRGANGLAHTYSFNSIHSLTASGFFFKNQHFIHSLPLFLCLFHCSYFPFSAEWRRTKKTPLDEFLNFEWDCQTFKKLKIFWNR